MDDSRIFNNEMHEKLDMKMKPPAADSSNCLAVLLSDNPQPNLYLKL